MSVLPSDLEIYGAVNMPVTDGFICGGGPALSTLVAFNDITPAGTLQYVSSSASDVAISVTIIGRDSSGVYQSETRTPNGQTPFVGAQAFERLTKGYLTGSAVGDIAALSATPVVTGTAQNGSAASSTASAKMTLAATQGASCAIGMIVRITNNTPTGAQYQLRRIIAIVGDVVSLNRDWTVVPTSGTTYSIYHGMLFDLAPNAISQIVRPFYGISSDAPGGAQRIYYSKIFAVNNNPTTGLTSASIIKQVDPSTGTLDLALCTALNDTGSTPNRQTGPASGITSYSSGAAPQAIAIPGSTLSAGSAPNAANAVGIWLRWTLPAGLSPSKTGFTIRLTGSST